MNETNLTIYDSQYKAKSLVDNYSNIMCSISGGSDSDILLDLIYKVDTNKKVKYVFFETGLEYKATREHLKHLEDKYKIKIYREWAKIPIPLATLRFGQPFLSKRVSENISRLQKHGFKWENESYETLKEKYPRCLSALKWWTNSYPKKSNGSESSFNINYNKYLKEFMLMHPPTFKISKNCCKYAKKDVAHNFKKRHNIELSIVGVRKSEGGVRATSYKNCITYGKKENDVIEYRPIFWFKNEDKAVYNLLNNIENSKCYTDYGLKRTGCAGCPLGRNLNEEIEVVKEHEPKLYKAIKNIFKETYEYTELYRKFVKRMKQGEIKNECIR